MVKRRTKTKPKAPKQGGLSVLVEGAESPVTWRNVVDLKPNPRNVKVHPPEQVTQLANLLQTFGWTYPILVDDDGQVIAGHGRLLAAKKIGMERVPTTTAKDWPEWKKRAYAIADNRVAENADYDRDLMKLELVDLRADNVDLRLVGFDEGELVTFMADPVPSGREQPAAPKGEPHKCPACDHEWNGACIPKKSRKK